MSVINLEARVSRQAVYDDIYNSLANRSRVPGPIPLARNRGPVFQPRAGPAGGSHRRIATPLAEACSPYIGWRDQLPISAGVTSGGRLYSFSLP